MFYQVAVIYCILSVGLGSTEIDNVTQLMENARRTKLYLKDMTLSIAEQKKEIARLGKILKEKQKAYDANTGSKPAFSGMGPGHTRRSKIALTSVEEETKNGLKEDNQCCSVEHASNSARLNDSSNSYIVVTHQHSESESHCDQSVTDSTNHSAVKSKVDLVQTSKPFDSEQISPNDTFSDSKEEDKQMNDSAHDNLSGKPWVWMTLF